MKWRPFAASGLARPDPAFRRLCLAYKNRSPNSSLLLPFSPPSQSLHPTCLVRSNRAVTCLGCTAPSFRPAPNPCFLVFRGARPALPLRGISHVLVVWPYAFAGRTLSLAGTWPRLEPCFARPALLVQHSSVSPSVYPATGWSNADEPRSRSPTCPSSPHSIARCCKKPKAGFSDPAQLWRWDGAAKARWVGLVTWLLPIVFGRATMLVKPAWIFSDPATIGRSNCPDGAAIAALI